MTITATALDIAREYTARGWRCVPVPYKRKGPTIEDWPRLRLGLEDLVAYFGNGCVNVGVLLGEASGGLTDVDLDTPEATAVAPNFLPMTPLRFGRRTKPESHYLFVTDQPVETIKFQDGKTTIVELRSTGAQTLFPGSVHPNGEQVTWHDHGDATRIEGDELRGRVADLAAAALMVRHWPPKADKESSASGCRHDASLALAGGLYRAGWSVERAKTFMRALAESTDADDVQTKIANVESTYQKAENGERITGWARLTEYIDRRVVDKVLKWIGVKHDAGLIFNPADPMPTARSLIGDKFSTDEGTRTIHHHDGNFWVWDQSRYVETPDAAIRTEVYAYTEPAFRYQGKQLPPFQPTRSKVENIADALKALVYLPHQIRPPAWLDNDDTKPDPVEIVPFRNGLLHLPSMKLLPPSPMFFGLNALEFDFQTDAPRPEQWLKFLYELWPDDPESITTLQEWFGYLLTPDTRQQKILMVVGPKRGGKGTIGTVLANLLGEVNVAGPTLASLASNFGLQGLLGKTAAIISDARLSGRPDQAVVVERLLSISGEDLITIDRKHRDPVPAVRLPVRFVLMSNELPRLHDSSGTLASRFIILKLDRSWFGKEDTSLIDRLLREFPGIFIWAADGWRALQDRGRFIQPATGAELTEQLEDLSSPVREFLTDLCVVKPGLRVLSDVLFSSWNWWAEQYGIKDAGTAASFGRDLRAAEPAIRRRRTGETHQRRVFYEGITLQGAEEDEDPLLQRPPSSSQQPAASPRQTVDRGPGNDTNKPATVHGSPRD